jgi:hypothetical protein
MNTILAISSYKIFPPHSGGQKGIALFYKYFSKEADVILVGTKNNDSSNTLGRKVLNNFGTSKLRYANLFYFFKLRNILKKNHVQTIIVEQPYMGIFGIMLKYFCKKKLVIHSHNIEGLRFKDLGKWWWRYLYAYEKKVHQIADFSFFINKEDKDFAIKNFRLKEEKTTVITYGTEIAAPLHAEEKQAAIAQLKQLFGIPQEQTVLLFNGVFGYKPNDEALYFLVNKIMPLLLSKDDGFTLLICGKNIPEEIKNNITKRIVIKGFVEDIDAVFKGAEIFLNPIWSGGGIKTKLVEALSFGASCVSFKTGAIGVEKNIAGEKLLIADDENIEDFVQKIIQQKQTILHSTPETFYRHFYWGEVAGKAAKFINNK